MDKSELDRLVKSIEEKLEQHRLAEQNRLVEQQLAEIEKNVGAEFAMAVRRAYENKDLDAMRRLTDESTKKLQRSRELMVEIDQLKWDVRELASDIRRSREGS